MKRIIYKQRDISDCGAACLASVLGYYRLKIPVVNLRILAGTNKNGTSLLGLIQAAREMGLDATGVRASKHELDALPLPCVIHQVKKELHHYVVLYSVGKRKVRIMDPAPGKMIRIDRRSFLSEWSCIALLLTPSVDFKPLNSTTPVFSRFWQLFKPHSRLLLQALTGSVFSAILGISMAVYLQKLTDYVLPTGDLSALHLMSSIMIFLLVSRVLIDALKELYLLQTAQLMDQRLIMGYFSRLTQMPQEFFDGLEVGELLSRVGDAVKVRNLVNRVGVDLLVNALTLICAIFLLLNYSWKLALYLTALAPIFTLIFYMYNRTNRVTERKIMEASATFETRMIEFLKASRLWRAFGITSLFRERVGGAFYSLLLAVFRSGNNGIKARGAAQLTAQLAVVISLWFGAKMVIQQEISAGELISFYAVTGYFTAPVIRLIQSSNEIQNALIAADRLFELMDSHRENREGSCELLQLEQHENPVLQLKNLSYNYSGSLPLLKNLNLCMQPGRIHALVGQSGCGKSTLLDLIHGTYTPTAGSISFGNTDLSDLRGDSRRNLIGLAREGDTLIEGTILENILLDAPPSFIPKAKYLCQELGADSFIQAHPDTYQKQVGRDGRALSMGQRQLLILTRVLLRNPRILLLDEATSALDAKMEKKVWRKIIGLRNQGSLILLVSHRMAMVRKADEIFIMERGGITAIGHHEKLISVPGPYREYCREQDLHARS